MESLAFTVLSRIEDVLHADGQTQNPSQGRKSNARNPIPKPDKCPTQREEVEKSGGAETPLSSMTLSDFMGWSNDQGESDKKDPLAVSDELEKDIDNGGKLQKLPIINTDHKKMSYLETMGVLRGRGEKEEMC